MYKMLNVSKDLKLLILKCVIANLFHFNKDHLCSL